MRTRRASYGASTEPSQQSAAGFCINYGTGPSSFVSPRSRPLQYRLSAKRARLSLLMHKEEPSCGGQEERGSCFDKLPDDLVLCILVCLSSRAGCPKDLLSSFSVCKRFKELASSRMVMSRASEGALRVRACQWCPAACTFLSNCANAGNLEACFTLGMIRFYCLMEHTSGLDMLARAAAASHADALHGLAVIHFNASGAGRANKNLKTGVHLCARAAVLGHVGAMRELGHCLQDGYGVPKNVLNGRRLILEANVREASSGRMKPTSSSIDLAGVKRIKLTESSLYSIHSASYRSLLSDYGCSVLPPPLHIAHEFLLTWFHIKPLPPGLRLCSNASCGRPETRKHEFRRCSACARVNYCSRACQALDWKLRHKQFCASTFRRHNHTFNGFIGASVVDPLDITNLDNV